MIPLVFIGVFMQEREEAIAKEAERQRIAKEKEIARLRSLQERAKDEQAEKVSKLKSSRCYLTKLNYLWCQIYGMKQ